MDINRSLKAFLQPVEAENIEIVVSDRFIEDGKPVPFVIRPISQEENGRLINRFSRKDKKGVESFDRVGYNHALTAAAVVYPDLDSEELQNHYGVLGAEKLLTKMLYIGEYAKLLESVQELSNLDKDINDDVEEVKN